MGDTSLNKRLEGLEFFCVKRLVMVCVNLYPRYGKRVGKEDFRIGTTLLYPMRLKIGRGPPKGLHNSPFFTLHGQSLFRCHAGLPSDSRFRDC
jgi:hypothetical protein